MVAEQGGLCAICREAPADQVDHDHKTNRVRGPLCFNCNGALGQFRDRPDLMLRAVLYLGRNVGDSLDCPDLPVGFAVGGNSDIPPGDEPRVA
jgi:Recombination endonuclease VII